MLSEHGPVRISKYFHELYCKRPYIAVVSFSVFPAFYENLPRIPLNNSTRGYQAL
jgi:hypothetical protein